MQPPAPAPASYHGFRATAALMRQLAKVEANCSVNGAVRTDPEGFLA